MESLVSDKAVRLVLSGEMNGRVEPMNRHQLQSLTKLPMSTIYQVFSQKRDARLAFGTVVKILLALGKSLSWLESEAKKIEEAMTAANAPKRKAVKAKPKVKAKKLR